MADREYASKGVAGAGLGTGIAGLATGAPALIIAAMNYLRDNNRAQATACAAQAGITIADVMALMSKFEHQAPVAYAPPCNEEVPATRYDLLNLKENEQLRAENAALRAEQYSDGKTQELYNFIVGEFNKRDAAFAAFKDSTAASFQDVAVYQATNTAGISCLRGQVDGLAGAFGRLTEVVIPSTHVCTRTNDVTVVNTSCNPVYTETVTTS